jgi:hypothetical protein
MFALEGKVGLIDGEPKRARAQLALRQAQERQAGLRFAAWLASWQASPGHRAGERTWLRDPPVSAPVMVAVPVLA